MEEKREDQLYLESLIKPIVSYPEEVKVSRKVDEMGVLLTLDVHPDDMGRVIGKQGNNAKAIRTLLKMVGVKSSARVNMKINEPDRQVPGPVSDPLEIPNFIL